VAPTNTARTSFFNFLSKDSTGEVLRFCEVDRKVKQPFSRKSTLKAAQNNSDFFH
jgi:hypothetical protein